MNNSKLRILSCFSAQLFSCVCLFGQNDLSMVARIDGASLSVVCTNNTGRDLTLFKPGSIWGDGQFYLVLNNTETGELFVSRYGQRVYGRHVPMTQLVPNKQSVEFRFDLRDRGWSHFDSLQNSRFEVESVMMSPDIDEEAISRDVFLDRLCYRFADIDE